MWFGIHALFLSFGVLLKSKNIVRLSLSFQEKSNILFSRISVLFWDHSV